MWFPARFTATAGMLPRRVRLSSAAEVDAQFRAWLREAYDRS